MQEDEIGLRRALGHHANDINVVQCARCGSLIAERDASVEPADVLEDGAEYRLLCPTCRDELAAGEQDLPLSLE